jgi:lipoprotein-anchoring transpeptidase ErfK/SrfK
VLDHSQARPKRAVARQPVARATGRYWGCIAAAGVLVLLGLMPLYAWGRIMPGVETLGLELGGRSRARATALLEQHWRSRTIVVRAGEMSWDLSPPTLGLVLDSVATVEAAYERGRSLDRIGSIFQGRRGISVTPKLAFDPAAAQASLEALAPQVEVPPTNAGVRITGAQVEAVPAVSGRRLDVGATVAKLHERAHQVALEGQLEVVLAAVPAEIADTSALVSRVREWFAHGLNVRAYDPVADEAALWVVQPDVWGGWGTLRVDPRQPDTFDWQPDVEQIQAFLAAQSATLGPPGYLELASAVDSVVAAFAGGQWDVHLRVYHHGQQHIVQFGETVSSIARDHGVPYPWIQQANPGIGDALRPGQALVIPSPDVMLPLPVVENKRIVISIGQQAMWVYQDGALLWTWPVSTGIESSPTSPGVFQILSHDPNAYAASWDLWMPYFMGIYRPVPSSQFVNGFHGFPTRDGANLLWTGNLGHPVTFGCILISTQNAETLYDWAEEGVVVEIQP